MPEVKKFKYPAVFAIAFLFIITLIDSISRGLYAGYPRLNIVTPLIFVILSAVLAFFYIIAGARLLRNVSRSKAVDQPLSERKQNLRRVENSLNFHLLSDNSSYYLMCMLSSYHEYCLDSLYWISNATSSDSILWMVASVWKSIQC